MTRRYIEHMHTWPVAAKPSSSSGKTVPSRLFDSVLHRRPSLEMADDVVCERTNIYLHEGQAAALDRVAAAEGRGK
jgi:hypothetical protein